jgi:hypothetical protein
MEIQVNKFRFINYGQFKDVIDNIFFVVKFYNFIIIFPN